MPREVSNKLSAAFVRQKKEPGRYADGLGLYLCINEKGARWWQWRGVVHGKRREIGVGSVRIVSLEEARKVAARYRAIARSGGDPAATRDAERNREREEAEARERKAVTFEEAARRVHAEHIVPVNRSAKANAQWLATLEADAFPVIGSKPVASITQGDLLAVLSPIWLSKAETARRIRQRMNAVLDWARGRGLGEGVHPMEGISKALPRQPDKDRHFAALPWRDVPALMERIEAMDGVGALALRFAILTAARSGEVRGARWEEIDLDAKVWTVPPQRMKGKREHRVPLAEPTLAVLRVAETAAGAREGLVFRSPQAERPLSDMALSAVLRRLKVPVTVHGFRSSFRDWAEEAGNYPFEVKEAALAHTVRSRTERAYRRGDLFEARRGMMEAWGAFATKESGKVIELRSRKG